MNRTTHHTVNLVVTWPEAEEDLYATVYLKDEKAGGKGSFVGERSPKDLGVLGVYAPNSKEALLEENKRLKIQIAELENIVTAPKETTAPPTGFVNGFVAAAWCHQGYRVANASFAAGQYLSLQTEITDWTGIGWTFRDIMGTTDARWTILPHPTTEETTHEIKEIVERYQPKPVSTDSNKHPETVLPPPELGELFVTGIIKEHGPMLPKRIWSKGCYGLADDQGNLTFPCLGKVINGRWLTFDDEGECSTLNEGVVEVEKAVARSPLHREALRVFSDAVSADPESRPAAVAVYRQTMARFAARAHLSFAARAHLS